ncbi:MAG: type III-B CRISPR module-associated protein Cmr3 [Flammeovirgaceae bacterium]
MILTLTALDTLFFRDGRPFDMGEDNWAETLALPRPSTLYGALRTWYAQQTHQNPQDCVEETAKLRIKKIAYWMDGEMYYHLPMDYVEPKGKEGELEALRLFTGNVEQWASSARYEALLIASQPAEALPDGLVQADFMKAYVQGESIERPCYRRVKDIFTEEQKIGIGIDNQTYAVEEGKLFRTGMMRPNTAKHGVVKIVLDIDMEGGELPQEAETLIRLGGETKNVHVQARQFSLADFEPNSEDEGTYFKIYLQTAAYFSEGWPKLALLFGDAVKELGIKPLTAAIGKPFRFGGYDMLINKPKVTYSYVPAGSVFYYQITKGNFKAVYQAYEQMNKPHSIHEGDGSKAGEGYGLFCLCNVKATGVDDG